LAATLVATSVFAARDDAVRGSMTKTERAYLLSELKSSEAVLLRSFNGLTLAQWTFKHSIVRKGTPSKVSRCEDDSRKLRRELPAESALVSPGRGPFRQAAL
jgi:hypothetical protein